MARSSGSSSSLFSSLLYFGLSITPLFFLSTSEETPFRGVSLENPVVEFVPTPHDGHLCERVHLAGISRINLKHYASSLHVMLKASNTVPEKLHGKAEVCFHRNVSKGLCQCEDDQWKTLQEGQWTAVISPYERRYIDVKVEDKLPYSFTITAEQEFQQWRLICLGFGVLLLLLAPIFSTWVPFYVGSSMAVGILAVVLLLVFQFMKLLPMGRKNILYITLYGSALGIGTYIAQYFSMVVNSILD
ncbi:uncharacterized protein LOC109834613, partial [Asparagus officinalis]|uniref:uncharacterized protein LOC109834613 n=1 Tax=Asparagus officinalis TaxID=4686 RepID=UPI00098E4CDC